MPEPVNNTVTCRPPNARGEVVCISTQPDNSAENPLPSETPSRSIISNNALAATSAVSFGLGFAFFGYAYALSRKNSSASDVDAESTDSGVRRVPNESDVLEATTRKLAAVETLYGIPVEGRDARAVDALAKWNAESIEDRGNYIARAAPVVDETVDGKVPPRSWLVGRYSHVANWPAPAGSPQSKPTEITLEPHELVTENITLNEVRGPNPLLVSKTEEALRAVEDFMGVRPDPTHQRARNCLEQWQRLSPEERRGYLKNKLIAAQTDRGRIPPKIFMAPLVQADANRRLDVIARQIYFMRGDIIPPDARRIAPDIYARWMKLPEETRAQLMERTSPGSIATPNGEAIVDPQWLELVLDWRDQVDPAKREAQSYQSAKIKYDKMAKRYAEKALMIEAEAILHDNTNPLFGDELRLHAEELHEQIAAFRAAAQECHEKYVALDLKIRALENGSSGLVEYETRAIESTEFECNISGVNAPPADRFETAKSAALEYLKARHPELKSEDKRNLYATMYASDVADGKVPNIADGALLNETHMDGIVSRFDAALSRKPRPVTPDDASNENGRPGNTTAEVRAVRGVKEERNESGVDGERTRPEMVIEREKLPRPSEIKVEVREATRSVRAPKTRIK